LLPLSQARETLSSEAVALAPRVLRVVPSQHTLTRNLALAWMWISPIILCGDGGPLAEYEGGRFTGAGTRF